MRLSPLGLVLFKVVLDPAAKVSVYFCRDSIEKVAQSRWFVLGLIHPSLVQDYSPKPGLNVLSMIPHNNGYVLVHKIKIFFSFFSDNVFAIKSWTKKKFSFDDSRINKAFGIPEDFDYLD